MGLRSAPGRSSIALIGYVVAVCIFGTWRVFGTWRIGACAKGQLPGGCAPGLGVSEEHHWSVNVIGAGAGLKRCTGLAGVCSRACLKSDTAIQNYLDQLRAGTEGPLNRCAVCFKGSEARSFMQLCSSHRTKTKPAALACFGMHVRSSMKDVVLACAPCARQ